MKNLFDKENFVVSSFEKKAKTQSLVLSILILVFFLVASFTFMNTLYVFADELGSIVSGNPDVAIKDFLTIYLYSAAFGLYYFFMQHLEEWMMKSGIDL